MPSAELPTGERLSEEEKTANPKSRTAQNPTTGSSTLRMAPALITDVRNQALAKAHKLDGTYSLRAVAQRSQTGEQGRSCTIALTKASNVHPVHQDEHDTFVSSDAAWCGWSAVVLAR